MLFNAANRMAHCNKARKTIPSENWPAAFSVLRDFTSVRLKYV
jgi:hypothetical protein